MGRPLKQGMDYYPLDVDFWADDKVLVFMEKYQLAGAGFLTVLWGQIYKRGKEPLVLDETTWLYLRRVMRISRQRFNEMLEFSLDLGLFSRGLFDDRRIVSSARTTATVERFLAERARKREFWTSVIPGETPGETPEKPAKEKKSREYRREEEKEREAAGTPGNRPAGAFFHLVDSPTPADGEAEEGV